MTKNEKIAREHYNAYCNSNYYNLWDCYGRYSRAKELAFEYCRDLMYKYNGYGLKIILFNSMQFSAGFEYVDSETGVLCFCYITKCYDRFCEI